MLSLITLTVILLSAGSVRGQGGTVQGLCQVCFCTGTRIDCHGANLFNELLPPSFPDNTTYLDLSDNRITFLWPTMFSNLRNLVHLDLSGAGAEAFPFDAGLFSSLTKLQYLSLAGLLFLFEDFSTFFTLPPGLFANLTSLRVLDMTGFNSLPFQDVGFLGNEFSTLTSLEHLILDQVTTASMAALDASLFQNLTNLKYLNMSSWSTFIPIEVPQTLFSPLVSLQEITLISQSNMQLPSNAFSGLSSLTRVSMTIPSPGFARRALATRDSLARHARDTLTHPLFRPNATLTPLQRQFVENLITLSKTLVLLPGPRSRRDVVYGGFPDFRNLSSLQSIVVEVGPGATLDLSRGQLQNLPSISDIFIYSSSFVIETLPDDFLLGSTGLQTLALQGLGLISFPLSANSTFPNLRVLILSSNRLSSLPVRAFASSPALTRLQLESNSFVSFDGSAFEGLSRLQFLSMSQQTLVNGSLPETLFRDLTSLETLSIGQMQLASLPPGLFANTTRLQVLSMESNQLTQLPSRLFVNTTQLRVINAAMNKLTAMPEIRSLTQLTNLSMFDNPLVALQADSFPPSVEFLFLNNVNLASINGSAFAGLTRLALLTLTGTILTAVPPTLFSSLTSLATISFLNNPLLTSLPETLFRGLDSLSFLDLSRNPGLTAVPSGLFQGLTSLTSLSLSDCRITLLPRDLFRGLPKLVAPGTPVSVQGDPRVRLANNAIATIEPNAMPLTAVVNFADMSGNPSVCSYGSNRSSAITAIHCTCATGKQGDSTYCLDITAGCLPGTTQDASGVCIACNPGTYTGPGHQGACTPCAAGTTDFDRDPSTPCVICDTAGLYVPSGSTGSCVAYPCPSGTLDHDNDPATPCQAVCDVCVCSQLSVDCSNLGLTTLPDRFPAFTRSLNLDNNLLTSLPALGLTQLQTLSVQNNRIRAIAPNFVASTALETIRMNGNPSSCVAVNSLPRCSCFPGFSSSDLTFCSALPVSNCPPGYVDHDSDPATPCVACIGNGTFIPAGSFGACDSLLCAAGTTDNDGRPSTACIPCGPGTHAMLGAAGECASLRCGGGTTDHDSNAATPCVACQPGAYLPRGSFGACDTFLCAAGTADADADPATPCDPCAAGSYTPRGSVGLCSSYACPAGTIDHDSNPSTPCVTLFVGSFAARGSAGPDILFRCPAGTTDDDLNASTPCRSCAGTANVFVPQGSVGACASFACAPGTIDQDNDPSTPCITPTLVAREAAKSGLSSSELGGLIAGVIIGLLLLLLLLLFLFVRRLKRTYAHNFAAQVQELQATRELNLGPIKTPIEKPRSMVKLLGKLGEGAFGIVHKGLMDERTMQGVPSYLVAVKEVKDPNEAMREEVYREATVMAQINHPHIVQLVGVVTKGEPLLMIIQYCEHGSLDSFLHANGANIFNSAKMLMAHDVASGMGELERLGFVHRDVAARNVLVSSDCRCKVSDFGHTRKMDENTYYEASNGRIAIRWVAPEAVESRKYSTRSDVWSYGVLLWEIWTNAELPYTSWPNERIWPEVMRGYRMPQPPGCPDQVYQFMLQCWEKNPHARPSFSTLLNFFKMTLNGDDRALLTALEDFKRHKKTLLSEPGAATSSSGMTTSTIATSASSGYIEEDSVGPATSHYVAEDAGGHYLMEDECKPQEAPRRSSHVIMNPYADEVLPGPRAGSDGYIVPMAGPLSGQTSSRASLDPAGRPSTDGVGYIDAINAIHGPSPLRESSQQGPPPQSHYLQEDAVLAAGLFKEELSQKEKAASQPAARHAPANHYVTEDTLTGLGPASAASSSAASPLRAPAALEPSTPPRPAPTLTAGSPLRTLGTLASASPPRAAAWSPASSTPGTSEDLPRPMNHYQDLDDPRARELPRYPSFDGRNLLSPDQFAESEV